MATPADLEDFGLGFSLTEGIIDEMADLLATSVIQRDKGIEIAMSISEHCFDLLLAPPTVLGALDCYVGYGTLEKKILPQPDDIEKSIREVVGYD